MSFFSFSLSEAFSGNIDLYEGDLCDGSYYSYINKSDVVFINNVDEVFAPRLQSSTATLDNHIAGIFAQMKPGSRMVTLYPLPVGDQRDSFFTSEQKHLGKK